MKSGWIVGVAGIALATTLSARNTDPQRPAIARATRVGQQSVSFDCEGHTIRLSERD